MKKTVLISFWLLLNLFAFGQTSFKTIVPERPVVEGESFRVQYVVENPGEVDNFLAPVFKGFRIVNAPEIREGKTGLGASAKSFHNTAYTLEPVKPGRYTITGAMATVDGKLLRSNDVSLLVISKEDAEQLRKQTDAAGDDPSYLRPGEDPYQKIKQNLFVKVQVSKKSCYPGEPVLATFKLFSTLQSSSEVVKNPGFYGFTIYDMVNLSDKEKTVEMINGKLFDVHTIRKVQLYPLQTGKFTIDPMEVHNKVELSRSQVSRKTEQKIIEGLMDGDDEDGPRNPGAEIFETTVATEPVTINVKPIAARNKPENFNGAIGRFTIEATLEKSALGKNEEGFLVVTIKGKGNFTQLSAPSLVWPKGIEGFEPSVKDFLDKTSVPLSGERSFRYAFASGQPGAYELPAVAYEYYDTDSNRYKTISTKPIKVAVSNKEKEAVVEQPKKTSIKAINKKVSLIAAGIIVMAVIITLVYWLRQKKEVVKEPLPGEKLPVRISVEELLQPAVLMIPAADTDFYKALQQATWKAMEQHFVLNGNHSKAALISLLKKQETAQADIDALTSLLSQCEMGIFTNAELGEHKETVVENARELLKRITEPATAGEP